MLTAGKALACFHGRTGHLQTDELVVEVPVLYRTTLRQQEI